MLTLRQVAGILGITEARVYQLDDILNPSKIRRGSTRVARHYDEAVVETFRAARETTQKARDEKRAARVPVTIDTALVADAVAQTSVRLRSQVLNQQAVEQASALEQSWNTICEALSSRRGAR